MVAFLAGGILANGLLALVSLALWRSAVWGRALWLTFLYINGFFAMINLVPFQKKVGTAVLRSDGRLMVLALLNRSASMPAPVFIQFVKVLRGLWESIGDRLVFEANMQVSAACWAELGLCLRRVNKAEAAARVVGPLLSIEGFQRGISDAPEERNRRLLRIGLRLIAVDALCAVGFVGAAVALVRYFGPERDFTFV
jgi:hypothetical protein